MEGHGARRIDRGGQATGPELAATTCEWPLGGVLPPVGELRRHTSASTGIKVGLIALIVAGLVLGTARFSPGQAEAMTEVDPQPRLGSEPAPADPLPDTDVEIDSKAKPEPSPDEQVEAAPVTPTDDAPLDEAPLDDEEVEDEQLDEVPTEVSMRLEDLAEGIGVVEAETDDGHVIHLTFDDGPHPSYTPAILDILARHDAKATFFVLGSLVEAYPELFERIVAEGHTVANHTWNHEDLVTLNQDQFNSTVGRTEEALGSHATPCLRPPFGSFNGDTRRWADQLGLELVLWDVDTLDWTKPGADAIAESIVDGADQDGSVILMHDGGGERSQTIEGLATALDDLADRDLRFEPIC